MIMFILVGDYVRIIFKVMIFVSLVSMVGVFMLGEGGRVFSVDWGCSNKVLVVVVDIFRWQVDPVGAHVELFDVVCLWLIFEVVMVCSAVGSYLFFLDCLNKLW